MNKRALAFAAMAVAVVVAAGYSTFAAHGGGAGVGLPPGLESSPVAATPTPDTLHVLGTSQATVHVPLDVPGARIEAGLNSAQGQTCFNTIADDRTSAGACGAGVTGDKVSWLVSRSRGKPIVVSGLVGPDISAVSVVTTDGHQFRATVENDAFLVRVPSVFELDHVLAQRGDGTTTTSDLKPANLSR